MSRLGSIDTREFARLGLVLEGRLPVAGFSRLASALCDTGGDLKYRLQGSVDEHYKAVLELEIEGSVRVICQRCLEQLELPLRICNRFRLIEAAPEWSVDTVEANAGGEDEIVATDALDVEALIEDEVLLSLPWAPRHQDCALASGKEGGAKPGRESPFGVLARLKNRAAV
jgi:uncharacterized protein